MRVVGLMSGTSVDGIDAVVVELSGRSVDLGLDLLAGATYDYPPELRSQILAACDGAALSAAAWAELDEVIGREFAQAAIAIQAAVPDRQPAALIGSHGQTVFHRPPQADRLGYSWQLGRGATIAQATGLPVVANFRVADLALRGQGAPLVPRVDAYLLGSAIESRAIQNIGGMGNVTYLPARSGELASLAAWETAIQGWDTGPGNILIDLAVQTLTAGAKTFDRDGAWAASGTICHDLVTRWLQEPFLKAAPPKSTGRELYSPADFQRRQAEAIALGLTEADLLATLTEFTAGSIAQNYRDFLPRLPDRVLVCGGGARNGFLLNRLAQRLDRPVQTTDDLGLDSNAKEAIAFAVLAYWHELGEPGNLPAVTGADRPAILGDRWLPSF